MSVSDFKKEFNYQNLTWINKEEFDLFQTFIEKEVGIHFDESKILLLSNRLRKRVKELGLNSFKDYYIQVSKNQKAKGELFHLLDAITTNKTEFFRNSNHFEFLKNTIFPAFVKNPEQFGNKLKIWSCACSTGEEPYSIAIAASEYFCETPLRRKVSILASDISPGVLYEANLGRYYEANLKNMDSGLLTKYFEKKEDYFILKSNIRSMVNFSRINLINEFLFPKNYFHITFCRNVLIYFREEISKRVLNSIYLTLSPGGYLFLGHSEVLPVSNMKFKAIGSSIYLKTEKYDE